MFCASRPPIVDSSTPRGAGTVRLPRGRFLKQWRVWTDPSDVTKGFGYRVRARLASQSGFTLIEVLVSALLTTLIASAVAGALITNTDIIANQNSRSQAEVLAQQDQERLKGLSAEQLDNLSQTYTAKAGGSSFTIISKAWYLSTSNGQSCTSSGGASATYFKTISTVNSTSATGVTKTLATDESIISPDAGGSLLVQFHDQTASPLAGVSLSASGPESDAGTSDANGCVIFSGLNTGTYALTYTDTGYVDPNGNASPLADTATVASTGITSPGKGNPIELGLAAGVTGNLQMTLGTPSAYPAYAAYAGGLSWFSSGGAGIPMAAYRSHKLTTGSTATSIATTNVAGTTGTGLFPFVSSLNPATYTNNYQVWAGTCRAEQPPTGYDMSTVTPGSGQTQVLQTPTLQLTVKQGSSTVTPTDVKFTFNSTDGSCSDVWGPMTAGSSHATSGTSGSWYYGVPFAGSATSGSGASASGQTGTVTACADLKSGTQYYKVTSSTFNTSFSATTPLTVTLGTTLQSTGC